MESERDDDEWLEESPLEPMPEAETMRDAKEDADGAAQVEHVSARDQASTDEPHDAQSDPASGGDQPQTIGATLEPSAQELPGGPPIRGTDRDQGDGGSSHGGRKPGTTD